MVDAAAACLISPHRKIARGRHAPNEVARHESDQIAAVGRAGVATAGHRRDVEGRVSLQPAAHLALPEMFLSMLPRRVELKDATVVEVLDQVRP